MKGVIVVFRLFKKTNQREINQFCKKFYGQNTSSHKREYHYRRKGLLDTIAHKKIIRGVLIILDKDVETICNFLKGYNAEIHLRTIDLTPDDEHSLLKQV